jgi:EAL domain-containing protein (putative c-di-GMP-specific phosphodiesterase class I)
VERQHDAHENSAELRRLRLTTDFQQALQQNELELHYQPRYRLLENRATAVIGVEALVRWPHPQLGLIYPGEFIPLAEQAGLGADLGEWVLHKACQEGVDRRIQGSIPLRVIVNLSARQFKKPDFYRSVTAMLQQTGFDAEALELALPEEVVMRATDLLLDTLRAVSELGVHLTINEFACGFLSLAQLQRIAVQAIEIENAFVAGLPDDGGSVAAVKSILDISRHFQLKTIAVGIENEAQLQFLYELGCQEIQGFLFSRPGPMKDLRLGKSRP